MLIIPKNYFLRKEKYTKFGYGGAVYPFVERYVFAPPKLAKLDEGYTVYLDAEYRNSDTDGELFHFDISSNTVLTFIKTEGREDGKKYKRYSFSITDLQALYNGHDLSQAETVVAKLKIYANTGNRHASKVVDEKYVVGQRIGCWFYASEMEGSCSRRRVDTHGVKIIGRVSPDKASHCVNVIKEYYEEDKRLSDEYYDAQSELEKMDRFVSWKSEQLSKLCPGCKRDVAKIKSGTMAIILKINNFMQENEKKREMLAEDLVKSLKGFCVE